MAWETIKLCNHHWNEEPLQLMGWCRAVKMVFNTTKPGRRRAASLPGAWSADPAHLFLRCDCLSAPACVWMTVQFSRSMCLYQNVYFLSFCFNNTFIIRFFFCYYFNLIHFSFFPFYCSFSLNCLKMQTFFLSYWLHASMQRRASTLSHVEPLQAPHSH